ncbi:MAG: hypothetical protein VW970_01580 [Candidatus Poseidoniales archaeon]|jgi:hypothetical protein|nr:hypothetical protein [Euryarchaeota archaeon]|tara:strand:- start:3003 stop:3641 length:639 start_codon:yes stop_codon:yes gene_type:complete
MESSVFEDKSVRLAIFSAMILGIFIGLAITDIVFDDYQTGLGDKDGDNVPDISDLEPNGDAGIRFTLVEIIHDEIQSDANITLILGYNDNGDSEGRLNGQVCVLNLTIIQNTSVTRPSHNCVFQVADYALRSVSFEYRMYEEKTINHETIRESWDIFVGDDNENPWGTNTTVDPAFLSVGSTILLDGMSDNDEWENNARVIWYTNSVEIFAD